MDALRLQDEFSCGNDLTRKGIDEEDIENLIIQQIEFCNIILLNKAAEVNPKSWNASSRLYVPCNPQPKSSNAITRMWI